MDIAIEEPILAGYFQERNNGEDFWVQYKFVQLSDFYYRCGKIEHVTGRCVYGEAAMVTTVNGISAKLYGPWVRAENNGSILFVNPKQ